MSELQEAASSLRESLERHELMDQMAGVPFFCRVRRLLVAVETMLDGPLSTQLGEWKAKAIELDTKLAKALTDRDTAINRAMSAEAERDALQGEQATQAQLLRECHARNGRLNRRVLECERQEKRCKAEHAYFVIGPAEYSPECPLGEHEKARRTIEKRQALHSIAETLPWNARVTIELPH